MGTATIKTVGHGFVPQDDYNVRLCGVCGLSKSQHQTTVVPQPVPDAEGPCGCSRRWVATAEPLNEATGHYGDCPEGCRAEVPDVEGDGPRRYPRSEIEHLLKTQTKLVKALVSERGYVVALLIEHKDHVRQAQSVSCSTDWCRTCEVLTSRLCTIDAALASTQEKQ